MKMTFLKKICDILITIAQWIFFLVSLLLLTATFPTFLVISLFLRGVRKQILFRRIVYYYLKIFFFVLETIVPGLTIKRDKRIAEISSSVIICNHVSYLDGLLACTLNKNIVIFIKGSFFNVPVLGWLVRLAGYIPVAAGGSLKNFYSKRLEYLDQAISAGTSVVIFPEGIRSKNGEISRFKIGAFKIALRHGAPLELVRIINADRLLRRNSILLNTCVRNTVEVASIGRVAPEGTPEELRKAAVDIYQRHLAE